MTEDNVNRMRVILCRPGEKAGTIEMENDCEHYAIIDEEIVWYYKYEDVDDDYSPIYHLDK